MATPHSLPQSYSQRIAQQLPFSPSLSNSSLVHHRPTPSSGLPIGGNISSIPPHQRSGSIVSSRSRHGPSTRPSGELPYTLPPIPSIPIQHPRPLSSATYMSHMSSSSFSNPLKPGASTPPPPVPPLPPSFQRPSSPGSIISSEAHILSPIHVAPFQKHYTSGSEVATDDEAASTEDLHHQLPLPSTSKSTITKPSREPLLPIGTGRKKSTTSRLSMSTSPYGKGDGGVSPSGRMRDSFERLFKRRLSTDTSRRSLAGPSSIRNSPSNPGGFQFPYSQSNLNSPHSPTARMTFEIDRSGSRYKGSSPPEEASVISQPSSWNPTPPADMNPPLMDTPVRNEKTGQFVRKYETYPSQNRYFLGGRLLTGGDSPWAFVASLATVLGIAGVFFGTTCVWWWQNESPAVAAVGAYMCLLTISSMAATAFTDPGILPRGLDPNPPHAAPSNSQESLRQPLPRDLKVRAGVVRVKYCPTCCTYRPPRSSHCKMCDNCVDNCDHHCQWVNNCVGRRNYTSFFTFLFSAVTTLVLVICTTAIHLWLLTRRPFGLSFRQALQTSQGVGSAVAFSMSILVIWPVTALLSYHARLLLLNVTTIEQIRNQAHKTLSPGQPTPSNPFSHGNWRRNLFYVLCRPAGYSWLDSRAFVTEDKREINPGLLEDEWISGAEEGQQRGGKRQ